MKPFPVPVVALLGPGSQEDESPAYLPMPQGMSTYQPPSLPEPDELAAHGGCVAVLREALAALRRPGAAAVAYRIDLGHLVEADRSLLNQVLGEGEVAAQVRADADADELRVQESVFAGVWRVVRLQQGKVVADALEIGACPEGLVAAAHAAATAFDATGAPLPPGVMNAPSLLAELDDRRRRWRPGDAAHVVNLTLLPLSEADSAYLDAVLGAGRVQILSRGYGNCRIVDTRMPRTWRVTYFNSTDIVILDTLEVCRVPEVACAAAQDLHDSAERLAEVLQWVRAG